MNNNKEEDLEKEMIKCHIKNCQKQIKKSEAISIKGKYFCGKCGAAYYRSNLNF